MKDPTGELLTAFATALASVAYNSKTWPVYTVQPPKGKRNYIYLSDIVLNENMAKDIYIFSGVIGIQISSIKDKNARVAVNSLANSILVLLTKVKLSMSSHTMIIGSFPSSVEITEETTESNYIKRLSLTFETQQK